MKESKVLGKRVKCYEREQSVMKEGKVLGKRVKC